MTWLEERRRIPSSGVVGLGVNGIGSLSPTFSTLSRGISPRFFVKASIFSTSLMLRASGMGMEVVPGLVELEVAVPRSRPAVW